MELTNMAAQVCASYLDRKDIKYSTVDGNHILGNADLIPRNDKRCDKIRERGRGV